MEYQFRTRLSKLGLEELQKWCNDHSKIPHYLESENTQDVCNRMSYELRSDQSKKGYTEEYHCPHDIAFFGWSPDDTCNLNPDADGNDLDPADFCELVNGKYYDFGSRA